MMQWDVMAWDWVKRHTLFQKHLLCTSRQQLLGISFYADLGPRFILHGRIMFKLHYWKIIWAVEPYKGTSIKSRGILLPLGYTSLHYCTHKMCTHLWYTVCMHVTRGILFYACIHLSMEMAKGMETKLTSIDFSDLVPEDSKS